MHSSRKHKKLCTASIWSTVVDVVEEDEVELLDEVDEVLDEDDEDVDVLGPNGCKGPKQHSRLPSQPSG